MSVNPITKLQRARHFTWAELQVGQTACFEHCFSAQDVETFAALCGDFNPLHTDDSYAASTSFRSPVLHGLLTASLLSRLVGMHLPGQDCLYQSQVLEFVAPAYPGECLRVSGSIVEKNDALRVLVIKTEIRNSRERILVRGRAQVGVRGA